MADQGLEPLSSYRDDVWRDSEEDRVGWECFIDDTDADMGDDCMHVDDESTRFGGGDTTDEEDFKLLGPPASLLTTSNKRKAKKSNSIVADVVTTAHQPPPLATWDRDGDEITIIDALPSASSPLPSPVQNFQSSPPVSPDLPAIDEFFDSSLLMPPDDSMSDASASSTYTITRTGTSRSRKDSITTTTSFNTDPFMTPANRGREPSKSASWVISKKSNARRTKSRGSREICVPERMVYPPRTTQFA